MTESPAWAPLPVRLLEPDQRSSGRRGAGGARHRRHPRSEPRSRRRDRRPATRLHLDYFRTRAALVAAAVDRLRELDAANYRLLLEVGPPTSLAGLIQPFAAFVEDATGPLRTRTVARYVIFVQGLLEPALLELLNADRTLLVAWTAASLTSLNVADAGAVASTVLAAVEGLTLHRLTGFVTTPPHPEIARVIGALCRGADADAA